MSKLEYPNELTKLKHDVKSGVEEKIVEPVVSNKSQWIQIGVSLMANATVLSSGAGLGFPAITLAALTKDGDPMALNKEQGSWFASINSMACPLGGILSATLLDQLGRKNTLVMINILSIISWSLMFFTSKTDFEQMYWQILLARFIIGITTGLSSSPAAVYAAEIATPKLRGRLTLLTSMAIAIGILMIYVKETLIYVLGYIFPDDWRLVSGIASAFCVGTLILTYFLPESPSWLISRGRMTEAKESLAFIRAVKKDEYDTNPALNMEMEKLYEQIISRNTRSNDTICSTLKRPEIYKPLAIINTFFAFQQFSGIFAIIVYASKFSVEAGVEMDPFLCTVLIGLVRVVATFLVAYVLDTWGRKPPTIFSGIGMTVCMFGLAFYSLMPEGSLPFSGWMTAFFLLAYIFTSTLGFLTIPFAMLPELFPQKVRGMTAGLTVCLAYLMSFIVIKLYPSMLDAMGNGFVFVFYGSISLVGIFFVHFILPETKGKTLEEIENSFKKKGMAPESDAGI